ncbi:hypothetical protein DKX38_024124 [Salix brachista]|uniref:Uncharacterized protein n=1 Tax=Salix brachista TaxID=2182728 RepID=A0A5N5JRR0_9ROSI|nr:hypothetical protein DKX38_024124 [Salix brachista]
MNIQVSSISSTITRIQQKSSSSRKPPFCSSRKSQEPNQNGDTNGPCGTENSYIPLVSFALLVKWNTEKKKEER